MKKQDPYDVIRIRGKEYSIKKIEKLYQKDTALYPKINDGMDLIWFCPSCNQFHDLDAYASINNKYCSYCGQRIKWPRNKRTNIVKPVVKKGDIKNV